MLAEPIGGYRLQANSWLAIFLAGHEFGDGSSVARSVEVPKIADCLIEPFDRMS
jgi:hypothetical protein